MSDAIQPVNARRRSSSINNGKKGGVKTKAGKAISCKNAIKHGILSNNLCEYDKINANELYLRLKKEFKAETLSQEMLIEQLVLCYIKLARCSRFEFEIMNESLKSSFNPNFLPENLFPIKVTPDDVKALVDEHVFKRMELVLTRYEPQLINRMINIINNLNKYQ